jgi:CheY-like chemotaxis protein
VSKKSNLATELFTGAGGMGKESRGTRRVLIIDDAKDVADVTVEMIRSLGHIAEAAYDGTAAMGKAVQFQPDTVLIDLVMPEMDGFELARELRAMFPGNPPKFIAYSGYKQAAFQDAARAVGFDEYLTKPASLADLEKLLGS